MDVKFITEVPATEDLFEGKGHSKSAEAIQKTLESQSEIKVIGIEGSLGGGKSTIINLLKQRLKEKQLDYSFLDFDLQQHHNSSIKIALINTIHDEIIRLIEPSSDADERLGNIRDVALGKILDYRKRVKSELNPLVIPFIVSLPLTAKYLETALYTTSRTLDQWFGSGDYSFSFISTATWFAGLYPVSTSWTDYPD